MDSFSDYFGAGGFVMLPLLLISTLLWYGMGHRYITLKRATSKQSVRTLLDDDARGGSLIEMAVTEALLLAQRYPRHLRSHLDERFAGYQMELARHAVLVRSLVYSAPLLGLLGTVTGMIETFDSLTSMALFSQDGGIAAGISQALITTQFGLVIAVPGLVISRMLDRRQASLQMELAQIKDIVCQRFHPEVKA